MTRINLLPWRDRERRRRRQRFLLALMFVLVAGIAIVYWGWLMADSAVAVQQARNDYLRSEVAELNRKIHEINDLQETRRSLIERMRVIQRLQQSRPLEVHLFEQLAATVPASVYLTSVAFRVDDRHDGEVVGRLELEGIAGSPAGVSNYMRRMAASPWLTPPDLRVVRTTRDGDTWRSSFSVSSGLVTPDAKRGAESGSREAGS